MRAPERQVASQERCAIRLRMPRVTRESRHGSHGGPACVRSAAGRTIHGDGDLTPVPGRWR